MTNLFQKHYEEDVLELDEIRKAPLSPHELSEAGLNHKDIDDYFILVKELYCELLLFNCQPEMIKVNKVYPNQVKEKFTKLIEFCFLKGLFDRATFEHFKGDKYCCPMDDLSLDAWRFVEYKSAIAIDSLDDFRLKLEDFLAAKSYSWYLDLRRYGGTTHSGFGLGFERMVMYLTGISNIRDVVPYPRTFGDMKY